MIYKTLLLLVICLPAFSFKSVEAEDSDSVEIAKKGTLTISGSADIYYRYDMVGKTKNNNLTSFTNSG